MAQSEGEGSQTVRFRSDVTVQLVQAVGDDLAITRAARVSVAGAEAQETPEAMAGLIGYLVKMKHASPLEHGSMTVLVECPIFVAREWMRHRTFSYNEVSGRYRHLDPVFWVPAVGRPVAEPEGFKPARPVLETDEDLRRITKMLTEASSEQAWRFYREMISRGVAREVARTVLPVGTYTAFYATANPRNWLNFLSLRTHDPAAAHVSYPLREIEDCARKCEELFAARWPVTHAAWVKNGRAAV